MPLLGAISLYIEIYDLIHPRTPHAAENPPHAADGGNVGYTITSIMMIDEYNSIIE